MCVWRQSQPASKSSKWSMVFFLRTKVNDKNVRWMHELFSTCMCSHLLYTAPSRIFIRLERARRCSMLNCKLKRFISRTTFLPIITRAKNAVRTNYCPTRAHLHQEQIFSGLPSACVTRPRLRIHGCFRTRCFTGRHSSHGHCFGLVSVCAGRCGFGEGVKMQHNLILKLCDKH